MHKKSGKNKQEQPKEGCDKNGSSAETDVLAEGALVANFPPASVGEEDLARDDAAVNSPPAPAGEGNLLQCDAAANSPPAPAVVDDSSQDNVAANSQSVSAGGGNLLQHAKTGGEPNFRGGDFRLPPEPAVSPDHIMVDKILNSLISLKPFFQKSAVVLRKTFNGGSTASSCFLDTRFCVETFPPAVVASFLKLVGINPNNSKKTKSASLGGGSAAFTKTTSTDTPPKKGDKKKKKSSETKMDVSSTAPVVQVPSFKDLCRVIFGSEPLLISSFFDYVVGKKPDAIVTKKLIEQVCSFLKEPTLEAFINLFAQSGGKPTDRHLRNLTIFKYLLDQYFSAIDGEDARFLAKMKFFMDIMSAQNQKSLFGSSRTREFLYDLAIELLRKLGRDTKRVLFDAHAAIVVLIFNYLYRQFDDLEEEDDDFQKMLVQLFRTMTECFLKNNAFLIEDLCFDDKSDLRNFRLLLTSQSTGLAHNSLLDCDLNQFMLNPRKAWKLIGGKEGTFVWMDEPGTGKSTLLMILAFLEGIKSKTNVVYVGPETATMNPEYVATIIAVVCQFMESCGHERPVIRLNQSGVAKHQEGVVTVFMTRVVGECLPLLSSGFSDRPAIVAVDDNIGLSPAQLKRLFDRFNVSQLHLCGSTMDISGCKKFIRIGEEVTSSVSFCAPNFIDLEGKIPMSPEAYRLLLLSTSKLRNESAKIFNGVPCGNLVFESNLDLLMRFGIIVSSFTNAPTIPYVDLVKLAKILSKGFPAFQVGKVYSVAELGKITGLVHKFIAILNDIGFFFEEECLNFPKDLSEAQRQNACEKIVNDHWARIYAQIITTTAAKGYMLEKHLVNHSKKANSPVIVDSKDPGDESDGDADHQKKKKAKKAKKPAEEKVGPLDSVVAAVIDDADAAEAAAAESRAAGAESRAAAAESGPAGAAIQPLCADDAPSAPEGATEGATEVKDDRRLTLAQILERILKETKSVGHSSLPTRKFVLSALEILTKCRHPDAARWFESFIYGVVLFDIVMPTEFIEICLEMFDQGRMIIVLAYELFPPLQSWNSKCCLRMKIVVADSVPSWVLRQIMARAGRLSTEHAGMISSWVSCLVLPNSDASASACESISEGRMQLMIGNGEPVCEIELAIMGMMCRSNFSNKHHSSMMNFLRLFRFAHQDKVCHDAFVGGRNYFMDFMKFLSGVLVSYFVTPFRCELNSIAGRLEDLAFTKFRHGLVDVKEIRSAFSKAVLDLVGPESASMSLCLVRAIGTSMFIGVSHFDLPKLLTELYPGYPNSLRSFLELLHRLLMNLQTMPLCKGSRTADATVSAMLLVITTTIDFVEEILRLLGDTLREHDMEQFRIGFRPEVTPLDQLRRLLRSKAGLPRLQDLHAFLTLHNDTLGRFLTRLDDICAFLSPAPSGLYHDMAQKCVLLEKLLLDKKTERQTAQVNIRPKDMKPSGWAKYQKSAEYTDHRKQVDEVHIPQLNAEIRRLEDEIALILKELSNLPTDLSEVVKYFQKLI